MILLLAGCGGGGGADRVEPSFVEVKIAGDGELGTEEAPLPFSSDAAAWSLEVRTLDRHGDPWEFEGDLTVRARPGDVESDRTVAMTGGTWSGEVQIASGFGPTRIWFGDECDALASSDCRASWATGVSDPVWYALPSIAEAQRIDDADDTGSSHVQGEYVEFRTADHEVVVTHVGTAGFWVTDVTDGPGAFSGLFVYSFNKPQDIAVGNRLLALSGSAQEYLESTQISFPAWKTEAGETGESVIYAVPDAVEIDTDSSCDGVAMEALEGSLVAASGARVPEGFGEGHEDFADFQEYGQWPVELAGGGCTLYADSAAVPDFAPTDHAGDDLSVMRGMLVAVFDKWIVTVRDEEDLVLSGGRR